MTEKEWLKAKTLDFVDLKRVAKQSQRKMRLFLAACCRRAVELAASRLLPVIDSAEQVADEAGSLEQMKSLWRSVRAKEAAVARKAEQDNPVDPLDRCLRALDGLNDKHTAFGLYHVYWARLAVVYATCGMKGERAQERARVAEEKQQLLLAHCIFGNPFRPVAFDPALRTESAVALARTAYDTRNFTLLPVLADALEEAGCDNADILTHCREPNATHARGCWVVDLVLNKS